MNYKPLPIGIDNFEKMINQGYYYVDKTLIIKELIDKKGEINLFTRPRRFGKTLNMSMFQYFFEKNDTDNSYLFDNLSIMKESKQYLSHMGKYPVINLTLKSTKQPNYDLAYAMLKRSIAKEFIRHIDILQDLKLEIYKKRYMDIATEQGEEKDYIDGIQFLSECLQKHHNQKVIILIDEYDVPLENSYFCGFYEQMINFIRSLFESALKTNPFLYFSVITGCLRISKESIFTGLNNLNIISIASNAYGEYFGFTENEICEMLSYYKLEHKAEEVRTWYNGYMFGETNVYNPWSMIKYLFDVLEGKRKFPIAHWANTSSNSIIHELIAAADDAAKEEVELLIRGESITKPIHEDIVYSEIMDNMDNLWNFLFLTGYLKKVSERSEDEEIYFELKIPNKEVKYIFERKIREWFEYRIKTKDLGKMYTAMLDMDTDTFQDELSVLLADTISYLDSHENFYHGFLLGSLALMKEFIVKSNRESGNGRNDIFIMSPSVRKCAIILELKVADKFTDLDEKCNEALLQIEEKKYDYELRQLGYSNILKYGIAFYRKDCLVKKL